MNTSLPTPLHPPGHALGAHQTQLLALRAGTELRCLQGRLQLQVWHTAVAGASPMTWSLPSQGAWRCPHDGWVSLCAEGPHGARYGLQAAPELATDQHTDLEASRAKKNRPGLIDLGRWWRALGRIRPWQRAA